MIKGDFQTFFKYVSLNVIGMVGISIYILADTIFIANGIGEVGLAALNLALPMFTLIIALGLLIGIGGATWYTILRAQDKHRSATSVFNHALVFGGILSLILVIAGILGADSLAKVLGADAETLQMTAIYLKVTMIFSPFFIFNNILVAFVRNDHNPKLAMISMFIGSITNILMDYLLIFIFDLGMLGAALATGATPLVSIVLLIIHFKSGKNSLVIQKIKWESKIFWKISTLGISAFITEISSGVVLLVFNIVILNLTGNTGVAAYGIVANIAFVVTAIYTGMAQGIQPIVSFLFGQAKYKQMRRILSYGLGSAILFALILYGSITIPSESIIGFFNNENNPTLAEIAQTGLYIYLLGFFFAGFNIISIAYLSAIEQANIAFRLSIIRGFILIVPINLVLSYLFDMTGVWLSFVVTEAITSAIISGQLLNIKKKIKEGHSVSLEKSR